jgi:hypothetical protein
MTFFFNCIPFYAGMSIRALLIANNTGYLWHKISFSWFSAVDIHINKLYYSWFQTFAVLWMLYYVAYAVLFGCLDFSLHRLYCLPFVAYDIEGLALHSLFVGFILYMCKFYGFLNSLQWCLYFDHIVSYCYLWGSSSLYYFCEHVVSLCKEPLSLLL